MYSVGFDSSCYTTSFAVVKNGEVIIDRRIVLDVPSGECGLRQSEAVFKHVQNYSMIMEQVDINLPIGIVSASNAPRDVKGSYMPVFTVGTTAARTMAKGAGAQYAEFSHQQGHISAGLSSAGSMHLLNEEFVAVHISGGTTEVLHSVKGKLTKIGGTLDIPLGQFIDRVGVSIGLEFPCGAHMEQLAQRSTGKISVPINVYGMDINLSGIENKLINQVKDTKENIAEAALRGTAQIIGKLVDNIRQETGRKDILIIGGVAANTMVRETVGDRAIFGTPELSGDNAVGVALLGEMKYKES